VQLAGGYIYKPAGSLIYIRSMKMALRYIHRAPGCGVVVIALLVLVGLWMAAPVSAASDTIEAAMGETINLHGVSYTGDHIYLFLTGPNLPANGVPLNDVTKRADQGAFTTVDVDSDQKWAYHWDTSRLNNRLDYGTYTVYVVTDPVDKSQLAGHPFSTLSVYLTNPGLSGVSISGGTSYTLRPEEHATVPVITSMPLTALPSPVPTPPATTPVSPPPSQSPSQKSGPGAGLVIMETGAILAVWATFRSGHR
jgi:hypothetical protein